MPGSSPTIARREPTRRLNKVDLPTLGRPTMAMRGILCMWFSKAELGTYTGHLHRPRGDGRPREPALSEAEGSGRACSTWNSQLPVIIETPCLPVLSPRFPLPKVAL